MIKGGITMSIEDDFNHFMKCLIEAGTKIDSHYFKLSVAGAENPIFRERVYCYELYHQLRCTLGDGFPYKLDGEVDKAGHPSLQGEKKPDFIVHVPGEMEQNLAVIEVKSTETLSEEVRKDIGKLKEFIKKAAYYRGVMLIYGNDENKFKNIQRNIGNLPQSILLVWHQKPGEQPKVTNNDQTT